MDNDAHAVSWDQRKHDVAAAMKQYRDGKGFYREDWSAVKSAPIIIGNKAWIGMNCIILKGVTIGEGAVVAAGTVVTGDVPAWSVVAGNPARVVRRIGET